MKELELSVEQANVVDKLKDFVYKSDEMFIALCGCPGVGKTFTITKFIESLNPITRVCVATPTHKSLNILQKNKVSDTADYKTIYSVLGLVPIDNEATKEVTKKGKGNLKDYDVLIVDEASMLPNLVINFMHDELNKMSNPTKIIYVGDDRQLPPVNEPYSPALHIDNKVELTTVMRADILVYQLNTQIRKYIEDRYIPNLTDFSENIDTKGNGVHIVNRDEFNKRIKTAFSTDVFTVNTRDTNRIVTYKNTSVDELNQMIRGNRGLDTNIRYHEGELLILKEPMTLLRMDTNYQITEVMPNGADTISYPISTELEVISVEATEPLYLPEYTFAGKVVAHECSPILRNKITARVLDDDTEITFTIPTNYGYYNECKKYYAECITHHRKQFGYVRGAGNIWDRYYRLVNCVSCPMALYALTSHSSQGSTFDNVYVDAKNILSMAWNGKNATETKNRKDATLRSLYVAVSRAKSNVILTF